MNIPFRRIPNTHYSNKHITIDNTQHTAPQSAPTSPLPPLEAFPRPSVALASAHAPPSHSLSPASTNTTWQSCITSTPSLSTSFTHFTGTNPISTRSSFITSTSTLHVPAITHVTLLPPASATRVPRGEASSPRHVLRVIISFFSHSLRNHRSLLTSDNLTNRNSHRHHSNNSSKIGSFHFLPPSRATIRLNSQ